MKSKYLLLVILLVGLGVGFAGGYYFNDYNQQRQFSQMRGTNGQRLGMPGGAGNVPQQRAAGGFGGMVVGEIISIDEKSITVKMQDESTKIIILGDSTTYSKTESIEKSKISTGTQVRIMGSANSDGSITAQNVQINP